MTEERYKKIMADLGMPNSRSLLLALQQVANESAQEAIAARDEELRKQEPVGYIKYSIGELPRFEPVIFSKCKVEGYIADWKACYSAPIPPTPSQRFALDCLDEYSSDREWGETYVKTIRDFILARPDATIPPEDLEDMEKRITELEACVAELLGFAGADKARIAELEALRTEHHRQYTENFAKLEAANDKMRKCLEAIAEHHKDCLMLDHGALNKLMQLYHTERRDFALEAAK